MAEALLNEELELEEDAMKGMFLTFCLGEESYGIEIQYVTEIIGIQPVTEVPELPEYIRGIINLRGKIIPVMDVRLRFHKEAIPYNDRTCIIVIDVRGVPVGLIIDGVSEVLTIPEQEIVEPPKVKDAQSRFVKGIGKVDNDVKLLLDCEKLLSEKEVTSLKELA